MSNIHPTAIIAKNANIAASAKIGAYCVIGDDVTLNDDVELISHVTISGDTTIGAGSVVYPFASLGYAPQDLKFRGEKSKLEIGKNNIIREHVTMNPGTSGGGMLTKTGNNCLFMVGSHVAHDCLVGNNVIMANNATLAGHVVVGDYAVIGGLAAIHQFVKIGEHAMIGGMSGVENDVIPFGSVMGERANLAGLNLTGMKRRNFPREAIHALRNAYKQIFISSDNKTLDEKCDIARKQFADFPEVIHMLNFITEKRNRAICTPVTNDD